MERRIYRPYQEALEEYRQQQTQKPEYWINPQTVISTLVIEPQQQIYTNYPKKYDSIEAWYAQTRNHNGFDLGRLREGMLDLFSPVNGVIQDNLITIVQDDPNVTDRLQRQIISQLPSDERARYRVDTLEPLLQLKFYGQLTDDTRTHFLYEWQERQSKIAAERGEKPEQGIRLSPTYIYCGETDYRKNRERVCRLMGVNPLWASVHHILFRSDFKRNPRLDPRLVNTLENLYPFSANGENGTHTNFIDHVGLHRKIQYIERRKFTFTEKLRDYGRRFRRSLKNLVYRNLKKRKH